MKPKKPIDLQTVLIVLLLVALCVCAYQIAELKGEVQSLKSQTQSQYSDLSYQISSMYGNVDALLKEQGSLLTGAEYAMGELDPESMTCGVEFTIVPKELTDDMTLTVLFGDASVELTREGDRFRGTLELGLFLPEEGNPMVSISSGGTTRTEVLEDVWLDELWHRALPHVNTRFNYSSIKTEDTLTVSGDLSIYFDPIVVSTGASFESFQLVTLIDGEETLREDISAEVLALKELGSGAYSMDFNRTYETAEGKQIEVYLSARDSLGYEHRTGVFFWYSEDGAEAESIIDGEVIYDGSGNRLSGK